MIRCHASKALPEQSFVLFGLCVQFFTTEPLACDPSSLPKYPPSKELNVKLRDEEARRYLYLYLLLCVLWMLMLLISNWPHLMATFIVLLGKRVLPEKLVVLMEPEEIGSVGIALGELFQPQKLMPRFKQT